MKNVFIEGLQGAGKSTLLQALSELMPQIRVCREGDYSPVDLAWCTWMTESPYQEVLEKYSVISEEIIKNTVREDEYYIISYTKILTDIPGFHKNLEQYEIYNGRKTQGELEDIILSRYRRFLETGYLFECSFFQNILEELILFQQLSDDEIVSFYKRLYAAVHQENFLLLYLYSSNIAENIEIIRQERSDGQGNTLWYDMMMNYLMYSPYGKEHACSGFDDLIRHFEHRQQLELRIIDEVVKERTIILPAKKWKTNEGEINDGMLTQIKEAVFSDK